MAHGTFGGIRTKAEGRVQLQQRPQLLFQRGALHLWHMGGLVVRQETLRGVKRFFSTYVHEVEFDRSKLTSDKKIQKVVEDTHVLIETDGERFRILEVGTKHDSPLFDVNDVPADKGTPWISAN